ncbi:MAG: tRNA1(Val) (adenine(37)-N6)-methyltransferase [Chthoniobacterales bacterium]
MIDVSPPTNFNTPQFRGWSKPGPIPPGACGHGPQVEAGETLDAISGYFRIFQLEKGHRFSTDDVLIASYGAQACPYARSVLDLGSGVGTVATVAAWCLPAAQFVTVEAQRESVRLAKKSVAWNGLGQRYTIREGDFRDEKILASSEKFDLIFGSPPYFPLGSGAESEHPQKLACRFELRGTVQDYCAVAACHLAPAGVFACVFPVEPVQQYERVRMAARDAGLSILRWRPVVLREGADPLLGLFIMLREEDLPIENRSQTWKESPLCIRAKNGRVHPEYQALKLSFGFPP